MSREEVIQKQIDEIMDWFDFDKVHKTMIALNWGWGVPQVIPEESELRAKARKMLRRVGFEDSIMCGSGGFVASRDEESDEDGPWVRMKLAFEVASWGDDGEGYTKEQP